MIFDCITQFLRLRAFRMWSNDCKMLIVLICTFSAATLYIPVKRCFPPKYTEEQLNLIKKYSKLNLSFHTFNNLVADKNNRVHQFNRSSPFIFIGSADRYSGSPLLGQLLNSHRDIKCGHELRAIAHLLIMKQKTLSTKKERMRLELAGVGGDVFEPAIAAFIIEVLTRHLQPAMHLCNEDYFGIKEAQYLFHLFPNSRFVLVVRDGRAVVHSRMLSVLSNHTTTGYNLTLYEEHLTTWNKNMHDLVRGCRSVGRYCLPVYYEYLLLHPIYSMKIVLSFLGISFPSYHDRDNDDFFDGMESALLEGNKLHVKNKLNSWAAYAPKKMFELRNNTELLETLGYLDLGNPPDYQKLSPQELLEHL